MLAAHGSLTIVANKFPAQLTPFVGRQDDVAAVREVLAAARLVTLTGAGGIGKTRLALPPPPGCRMCSRMGCGGPGWRR